MSNIKDSPKSWAVLIMDIDHRILVEHTQYFWTKWGARRYVKRLKNLQVLTPKIVSNR